MNDKATILLVDDQERNLDSLEAILEPTGYELMRARSAEEALMALLKGDFAAIVCDIRMPGIGGIELAKMIKLRKRTRHIPILFLTAHLTQEDDLLLGYGAGAVDYLSKPMNPEILRSKLAVFVELFRTNRALAATNISLAEEVAQRQRAEEDLRQAKQQLEQRVQERTAELSAANSAKDHFLAVLSHELRTPLTPVLATIQELMDEENLPPDLRSAVDLINRNIELEARLIDDLLDVTRITRGKMQLQATAVNLHQVLKHALRTCEADFESKQIDVHVELNATNDLLWGDRARLLQVFWNLLKNAAKFTPEGQRVEVCTRDEPGNLMRVEVRDTGIGIDSERLHNIFNAFEQGASSVTRQYGGLGLGLSIGKALVELHGGKISATSPGMGHGAVFVVELPQSPHLANAEKSNEPQEPGPRGRYRNEAETNASILLVEDHIDTSHAMQRLLRHAGYQVTIADSVAAALRAFDAAAKPFDALVSDIGLPDGSGLDLMRQVRARYPRIPGVALSGFGMEDDLRRSIEAGFSAHLTKPVNVDVLHATLRAAVQEGVQSAI